MSYGFTDCLCDENSGEEMVTTKTDQQVGLGGGDFQVSTQPSIHPVQPPSYPGTAKSTRSKGSDPRQIKVAAAPLTTRNLRLLDGKGRSKRQKRTLRSISRDSSIPRGSQHSPSAATAEECLSTMDYGFERQLRENGVVYHEDSWKMPPSNLDELTQRFQREMTRSTEPSEREYLTFRDLAGRASNERDMAAALQKFVFKDSIDDPELMSEGYRKHLGKQWIDYPKDQGFNNGLSKPTPEYVEGYTQSTFPPTIHDLGGAVTLENRAKDFITLPHFAAEFRGREANIHAARVQAGYVGAAMTHGRSIAMEHLGDTDPPRHAAVVTAVTDGMLYQTYAHYQDVDQRTGEKLYYQYPVESGTLDTYRNYQQGYRVLRNAQSFAQEQSKEIRDRLNQQYAEDSSLSPSDDTVILIDA